MRTGCAARRCVKAATSRGQRIERGEGVANSVRRGGRSGRRARSRALGGGRACSLPGPGPPLTLDAMSVLRSGLPALWRTAVATMLQYRGEIALWAVWGIVYPAVSLAMWSAAVRGAPGAEQIGGYRREDFAAYFLLTMMVGHLCTAWDVYEMGHLVRSGRLSPALLRPMLPLWGSLADNLAYKFVTLAIVIPVWLLVTWVVRPHFQTTGWHLALGVPAVGLAMALNFLWGYTLSLLAFWTTRTDAAGELWFGGSLLLGGGVGPLALLPAPLYWLSAVAPFKWILWFPVEVLRGHMDLGRAAAGIGCQVLWLAAGLMAFRIVWRAGLKRYTAVGA